MSFRGEDGDLKCPIPGFQTPEAKNNSRFNNRDDSPPTTPANNAGNKIIDICLKSDIDDSNKNAVPGIATPTSTECNRRSNSFGFGFSPITPSTNPVSPQALAKTYCLKNDDELSLNIIMEKFTVSPELYNLELEKAIGKGSVANVFQGKLGFKNHFSQVVAVKVPLILKNIKYIKREALIFLKFKEFFESSHNDDSFNLSGSPFINCFGIFNISKTISSNNSNIILPSLLLEKADCDLETYIKTGASIGNLQLWWKLANTLISALVYLKKLNLVHCDFKTSNILMVNVGGGNGNGNGSAVEFKVSDFTSSISKEEQQNPQFQSTVNTTLQFCAPELLSLPIRSPPDFNTDLYAVGAILLHMATGKEPYFGYTNNITQLMLYVKKNYILKCLDFDSSKLLQENKQIFKIIEMILTQRCNLKEVIDYIKSLDIPTT
ncbi:hypothetical protein PACTADRAFT_49079 [Pachysolen tannophilus NRRL Y-2460]|uniref:Protein kinase domain-containing protein n=1 Tax=Pachysolen tannophilus NRRL Y-2460 TaxID=669874 RepID=A0A1E4U035_PACTA|nr:hypothetical protein PACTADRAFT_49079 [Pachysolen tannophilus NRRL Y-2460]